MMIFERPKQQRVCEGFRQLLHHWATGCIVQVAIYVAPPSERGLCLEALDKSGRTWQPCVLITASCPEVETFKQGDLR
jgi:hypothetical protein